MFKKRWPRPSSRGFQAFRMLISLLVKWIPGCEERSGHMLPNFQTGIPKGVVKRMLALFVFASANLAAQDSLGVAPFGVMAALPQKSDWNRPRSGRDENSPAL
jgi:hypothetical protein